MSRPDIGYILDREIGCTAGGLAVIERSVRSPNGHGSATVLGGE